MRIMIGCALLLAAGLCHAEEWENALRLESWSRLHEYWQTVYPQADELGDQQIFGGSLRVEFDVLVRPDGTPQIRLTRSSGNADFDRSALEFSALLRFRPTDRNDPPTAVIVPSYAHTSGYVDPDPDE